MTTESDIIKDKLESLQLVVCKVSESGSNIDNSILEINQLLEKIQNNKLEKKYKKKNSFSGESNTVSNSRRNSEDGRVEDNFKNEN
jgi:hypothetical protein